MDNNKSDKYKAAQVALLSTTDPPSNKGEPILEDSWNLLETLDVDRVKHAHLAGVCCLLQGCTYILGGLAAGVSVLSTKGWIGDLQT
jgi:hypothetical protein